jgi:hypothetical protein
MHSATFDAVAFEHDGSKLKDLLGGADSVLKWRVGVEGVDAKADERSNGVPGGRDCGVDAIEEIKDTDKKSKIRGSDKTALDTSSTFFPP